MTDDTSAAAVLGDDDLDVLELVLRHGLEVIVPPGVDVLLDRERTPVGAVTDGRVTALRPLAPRPELAGIAPAGPLDAAVAVLFDALPTRAQVAAVDALPGDRVAWVALAGRARTVPSAAALAAAVSAAAAASTERSGRTAPSAVLPWSLGAVPTLLRAEAIRSPDAFAAWATTALGVEEVVVFGAGEEHDALRVLEEDATGAARALFPPEVLPFHRGDARRGSVVLFTGLSGSGKSTVAGAVAARLRGEGRVVSVLDGDDVRELLSAGLGFDAEGRALNVRRIGWIAAEIARAGGTAVAAPIAPFADGREGVRRAARAAGAEFVLVHVSTSLAVCEARDRKGLYAAARAGRVADFTGISSPYEEPADADVVIDTAELTVDESADRVLAALAGAHA